MVGVRGAKGDQPRPAGLVLKRSGASCPPFPSSANPLSIQPLSPPTPLPAGKEGNRTFPQTGKTVSGLFLKYWNEHAFDAANYAPAIRNLMGNDASHEFFGRKLVYNVIDGGSNQCPDKTTAAAKQAANEDHAFVVFRDAESSRVAVLFKRKDQNYGLIAPEP